MGVWLRNSHAVRFCRDWILLKFAIDSNHIWQIWRKDEFTCQKPNQTKQFTIPCFFFTATWYLSPWIILPKSNIAYKLTQQCKRWLKRRSCRGKNRCFRRIFHYFWRQSIRFKWIRSEEFDQKFRLNAIVSELTGRYIMQTVDSTENQPLFWPHIFFLPR